jgi:hypothetical protein
VGVKKFCISSTQNRSHVKDEKERQGYRRRGNEIEGGETRKNTGRLRDIESKKMEKRKE